MSHLRQGALRRPAGRGSVLDRYPPAAGEGARRGTWAPWARGRVDPDPGSQEGRPDPGGLVLAPRHGQPLHIRVTPERGGSAATLEITRPTPEEFFSSTAVIPTLGSQAPRITIVPAPGVDPERAASPVTITTLSRERATDGRASPLQVRTVATAPAPAETAGTPVSPGPQEAPAGRTVLRVTPEKQPGPSAPRRYNANASIITTEDNRIHIHLGAQGEGASPVITVRPAGREAAPSPGLRAPRGTPAVRPSTAKVTSTITITPATTASTRGTQAAVSSGPPGAGRGH